MSSGRLARSQVELVAQAGFAALRGKIPLPRVYGALELRAGGRGPERRPWGGVALANSRTWFCCAGSACDRTLSGGFRLTTGTGPFFFSSLAAGSNPGFDLNFFSFSEVTHEFRRGVRFGRLAKAQPAEGDSGARMFGLLISLPLRRHHS
jgi:hypothetical protein